MRRFARRIALDAMGWAFYGAYKVGGLRPARWFERYVGPKVDRLIRANLRAYQREAFRLDG